MFGLRTKTSDQTEKYLKQLTKGDIFKDLDRFGQQGVDALARATPVESGLTASSWYYEIVRTGSSVGVAWYNSNNNRGANIAILLQYGHGTGTGGWVSGYDYINPAVRPIFDKIADDVWKKVKNG